MGAGDRMYWTDGSGSYYAALTEQVHETKHKWSTFCTDGKSMSNTDCLGDYSSQTMNGHQVPRKADHLLSMSQGWSLLSKELLQKAFHTHPKMTNELISLLLDYVGKGLTYRSG